MENILKHLYFWKVIRNGGHTEVTIGWPTVIAVFVILYLVGAPWRLFLIPAMVCAAFFLFILSWLFYAYWFQRERLIVRKRGQVIGYLQRGKGYTKVEEVRKERDWRGQF